MRGGSCAIHGWMDGPVCLSPSIEVEKLEEGQTDKGCVGRNSESGMHALLQCGCFYLWTSLSSNGAKGIATVSVKGRSNRSNQLALDASCVGGVCFEVFIPCVCEIKKSDVRR